MDDLYLSASRSPDEDNFLESDSKTHNEAERLTTLLKAKTKHGADVVDIESDSRTTEVTDSKAERLTNLLKAEVRHVVDGLVDGLIQRFLTKHFACRRQPSQSFQSTDDRPWLDFPRPSPVRSLPVFPLPPPPLLPFPVGGGDILGLRRAYAERCAYVDALVQRSRTSRTTDPDNATSNYNNSTSGSVSCAAVTSSHASEVVDNCSLMSALSSRGLLPDRQVQILQPRTQVGL